MGHLSKVYETTNKLSIKPAHPRVPVKDKAGKVLTNMEEQLRRWREHFEVLNQPCETTENADDSGDPPLRIRTDPPSKIKIVRALKEIKNNKSARIDGILEADLNVTADAFLSLFSDIFTSETISDD
jgi:hypothetical protein